MATPTEEVAFPRGGKQALSAIERKRLRDEGKADAEKDFLTGGFGKKKQRVPDEDADEELAFAREASQGRLPKFVELLKFRNLSVGCKVWGCVMSVTSKELIVSLPDGLRGTVAMEECSDVVADILKKAATATPGSKKAPPRPPPLQVLFHLGQLVRAVVVDLTEAPSGLKGAPKKKIWLSLRVGRVNGSLGKEALVEGAALPACVKDVEDHGYSLTFGIKGTAAFLDKESHNEGVGGSAPLVPGSLVEVVLTNVADKRLVRVTTAREAVSAAVTKEWKGLTIGSLLPGALVNAKIRHILSDGLLVSFLTYFNGTIDPFHISMEGTAGDWQSSFSEGQKVRARVVYVDATAKKVCLSLLPHLLRLAKPQLPEVGSLIKGAIVQRVDPQLGVLLSLQKFGAGYAHISDISDERVDKLEKALRPGQTESARIIGSRPMDGLAVVSLKPSAVDQYLVGELRPGQVVKGEVVLVDDNGLLVSMGRDVKAFVPNHHISDLGAKQGKAKHKVGSQVTGRVLTVDSVRRRISLTLKKALVGSKLEPLASWEDVTVGKRAAGTVTGFAPYGCFVAFFGDVKGMAHATEMDLPAGKKPSDCFEIGQVVKARILAFNPDTQRLQLSLTSKKSAAKEPEKQPTATRLNPGEIVDATVARKTEAEDRAVSYEVDLWKAGEAVGQGRLDAAHLSDHPGALEALQEAVQEGTAITQVMVLEQLRGSGALMVTCKPSLLDAAAELPSSFADLKEGTVLSGYVANVVADAVFVRFLGGLTGRAGLAQLADTFVSDPHSFFTVGQSVTARIAQIDSERQQFSVSLKQSVTGNRSAAYAASLFRSLESASLYKTAAEVAAGEAAVDWANFGIGRVISAVVHELKEYGVICDLVDDDNLVGLIPSHQVTGELEVGAEVRALVMDVNKASGIVELTNKEALMAKVAYKKGGTTQKKASSKSLPAVGLVVEGEVQLAREDYAIVSLPGTATFAFLSLDDFNVRDNETARQLPLWSKPSLVVKAHPSTATGGRLILELLPAKSGGKKGKKGKGERVEPEEKLRIGSLVSGIVKEAHQLFVVLQISEGAIGRVHVTNILDDPHPAANPIQDWEEGRQVQAVVIGGWRDTKRSGHGLRCYELSSRPSYLAAARAGTPGFDFTRQSVSLSSLSKKVTYQGWVAAVASDYLLVSISPTIAGRVFILDAHSIADNLARFKASFQIGQPVTCHILKADKGSQQVDLSLIADQSAAGEAAEKLTIKPSTAATHARAGDVFMGRVVSPHGWGVRVQIGSNVYGTASLFELHDSWVDNALERLPRNTFLRCRVLATPTAKDPSNGGKGKGKRKREEGSAAEDEKQAGLQLTLRSSAVDGKAATAAAAQAALAYEDLKKGQEVCGYVKGTGKHGIFVALAPGLDARVKMSNLADSFVEDPAVKFPLGQLVKGHIVSLFEGRVEMSLRSKNDRKQLLKKLKEGQVVRGTVQRVKDIGVFVQLEHSSLTGFVHKSELSDKFVSDVHAAHKVGQGVRARVLGVDIEKERLKLGTKESYFLGEEAEGEPQGADEAQEEAEASDEADLDEAMLEAADVDSDDGADWRNAAAESDDEDEGESEEDDEDEEGSKPGSSKRRPEGVDLDDLALSRASKRQDLGGSSSTGASDSEEEASGGSQEDGEDSNDGVGGGIGGASAAGVGWGDDELDDPEAGQANAGEAEEEDKKLNKRQVKRQKREREEEIRRAELARVEGQAPSSAADFEREVMASPNSSLLWIKYMAFQISLGEVEKARAVSEQALQRIHYREEGEKFNIWQARLNLEMQYGDPPQEAVMKLFQRALSYADQKKLYIALINILEKAGQEDLLQQTYKAATRKFGQSAKVWLHQVAHFQRKGDAEGARKTLERATATAPARKHVKILRQAAMQEFKLGSPERGRSIFENLLRNYPKRMDLWSIYIDQEIKQGESVRIRGLFERATSLQLPAKKIKFLFKRSLEYEQAHGTPQTVAAVKQAARDYVERHLASA